MEYENRANAGETAKGREVLRSSFTLLETVVDIQDSLSAQIPSGSEEKETAEKVNQELIAFFDSALTLTSAQPRTTRERDEVPLLPGQHAGISLTFAIEDKQTLRVNVYGGLRVFSSGDMRDGDTTLKNLHDKRTEKILSQPTLINWHIKDATGASVCDVWIKKTMTSLSISKMFYLGEKVDVLSTMKPESYGFKSLVSSFEANINTLTKHIPSSG